MTVGPENLVSSHDHPDTSLHLHVAALGYDQPLLERKRFFREIHEDLPMPTFASC